jgi:hypothetical protein
VHTVIADEYRWMKNRGQHMDEPFSPQLEFNLPSVCCRVHCFHHS